MSMRTGWIFLIISSLIVVGYALQRDIRYDRAYPGDLRNRVVGARMIEDGKSPYFYKWKKGDPIRYYDPTNFDSFRVAVITSSPFLHHMLVPLVNRPEVQVSKIWLAVEYLLLISMTALAYSLAKSAPGKMAVVLLSLLFLLTNAWKKHTSLGQTYICIPFFALLFFFFFRKNKQLAYAPVAGAAAACLVLIRINTIFFFIPFLFLFRQYSRSWLLAFFIPVFLLAGWTLANRQERGLWLDYGKAIADYTDISQGHPAIQYNEPGPQFNNWEGVDMKAAAVVEKNEPDKIYSENGNFFVIVKAVTHYMIPAPVLGVAALSIICGLLLVFCARYFRRRSVPPPGLEKTAIFGFCLYMITDLFSPVYRHQYYTVQWLFPLLIAAAILSPRSSLKWPYLIIAGSLLLSCVHLGFLKMQNTIAEYLIMASLLVISLFPEPSSRQESTPASLS